MGVRRRAKEPSLVVAEGDVLIFGGEGGCHFEMVGVFDGAEGIGSFFGEQNGFLVFPGQVDGEDHVVGLAC